MRIDPHAPGFWPMPAVDRRLAAILVLSLLIHGLLLWQSHGPSRPPVALDAPRLLASLRQAVVQQVTQHVATPPAPAEAASPPKVRQAVVRPALLPASPTVARPVEPAHAPVVAADLPALPAAAGPTATAAATPPGEPSAARPPSPEDWMSAYRTQLTALFARRQGYPRIAAERGWEGEVRLRLRVARKGTLLGVVLERSSGFAVLDQHALAMAEGLGSLPPLPETSDAGEIQVIVPVNYHLRKTT